MKIRVSLILLVIALTTLAGCQHSRVITPEKTSIFIAADSTAADHTQNDDYWQKRHPVTGWGQRFQEQFDGENLTKVSHWVSTSGVHVINKARGGRSTRTFFEEGRWRDITQSLKPNDLVLIQFGHNDQAIDKTERYVTLQGYKEYLRLFITQTREKGAIPILMTPVNRNYPWKDGVLLNSHGDYPDAAREVAKETGVAFIDLGILSRELFANHGQEISTQQFFMNLPKGKYSAYPDGLSDNTHFQPEGARVTAELIFVALSKLPRENKSNVEK